MKSQSAFAYRFDWGLDGLHAIGPDADVIVIVDVLRFTTAVSCALEAGSVVLPHRWVPAGSHDEDSAAAFARANGAVLAGAREAGGPSLSPTDLLTMPVGSRLVLPSPNGATLACAAAELRPSRVLAASLRNATATASSIRATNCRSVAVVAAGERWRDTEHGTLRVAIEDLLGAGAVLAALDPSGAVGEPRCSPEARAARVSFLDARPRLYETLCASPSGAELLARGWEDDVATSAALDVSTVVAELVDGVFTKA